MSEHDENEPNDTFDQFKDLGVKQLANLAQLVAEARRLGLAPELPRELVEEMDLGGTMMDLLRIHLKHATAVANVVGKQGRNLEKLNYLSAVLAKGKSQKPRIEHGEPVASSKGRVFQFEITLDNPVERRQLLQITLGKLYSLQQDGETIDLSERPNLPKHWDRLDPKEAYWGIVPNVQELEPRELRTVRILLAPPDEAGGEIEVTATAKLSPLGTYNRYQLRISRRVEAAPAWEGVGQMRVVPRAQEGEGDDE